MTADESKPIITLPIDIFTHIIQALTYPGDSSDIDSIIALSLTCRDLVPLCQRQIFRTIVLKHNGYRSNGCLYPLSIALTVNKLHSLLEIKPVVADYVKVLQYNVHTSNFGDEMVFRVLRSLRSLENVRLSFSYEPPNFARVELQEWDMIPGDLQKALLEMIQQPGLMRLTIDEIGKTPPTILYSTSSAIRSLNIKGIRFAPLPSPLFPAHAPAEPIPLTSLSCTVSQWKSLHQLHTDDQTPLFDFSTVRALSVTIHPEYDQSAGSRILGSFQNVEDLSISDIHHDPMRTALVEVSLEEFMDVIDTTALQNIKSIHIDSTTNSVVGPFLPFKSLRRFTTFQALQRLCLSITATLSLLKGPSGFRRDLAKLDEHLTSPLFPVLKELKLNIYPDKGEDDRHAGVFPSKDQCFPLLVKSEKIRLEFTVW